MYCFDPSCSEREHCSSKLAACDTRDSVLAREIVRKELVLSLLSHRQLLPGKAERRTNRVRPQLLCANARREQA